MTITVTKEQLKEKKQQNNNDRLITMIHQILPSSSHFIKKQEHH